MSDNDVEVLQIQIVALVERLSEQHAAAAASKGALAAATKAHAVHMANVSHLNVTAKAVDALLGKLRKAGGVLAAPVAVALKKLSRPV
jgi:hypothetical protein